MISENPDIFYVSSSIVSQFGDKLLSWIAENEPDIIIYLQLCQYFSSQDQILHNCTVIEKNGTNNTINTAVIVIHILTIV